MLQVVAAFDEARSGSEVPVSVLVASGADTACTADLREVAVELTAGADVVYSTAHCETPQGEQVELADGAGQTVEFTVDGLASEAECAGARRELPAGEYELRARLGDAVSAPRTWSRWCAIVRRRRPRSGSGFWPRARRSCPSTNNSHRRASRAC